MVKQERDAGRERITSAAPTERADLDDYLRRIRTDDYLDAHPALSHALGQAFEYQACVFHRFGYNPATRVYGDWCDPQKRRAMEQAFEDEHSRRLQGSG